MGKITRTWTAVYTDQPVFTKEQVENITKKATRREKLRLLLRENRYSIDGDSIVRYKEMDDKLFVMKRGTRL